jgi:hypothetical protein
MIDRIPPRRARSELTLFSTATTVYGYGGNWQIIHSLSGASVHDQPIPFPWQVEPMCLNVKSKRWPPRQGEAARSGS